MPIAGKATPAGTTAYRARFPRVAGATLGRTELQVSQAGFGGYRIDDRLAEHREALTHALRQGINLIDTSSNYSDGHSESLIGEVLAELIGNGELARAEVVVVSKAGYVQGQNLERAREREAAERPFPEMVKLTDDLWHCLHPRYLEDQLSRSLERLQLEQLDVFLLHNPEYFLKSREPDVGLSDRREYDRRLQEAFGYLETQVAAGRIGCYGVSSNTLPLPAAMPIFTSLDVCLDLAGQIMPDHHLQVIQLPANLYEHGFATEKNQPPGRTVLERASAAGLGVLINRPLNAFAGNALIRLADVPPGELIDLERLQENLNAIKALEARLLASPAAAPHQARLRQCLQIGEAIEVNFPHVRSHEHWQDVIGHYLAPRINLAWHLLSQQPSDELDEMLAAYRQQVTDLMARIGSHFRAKAQERTRKLHRRLDPFFGEQAAGRTLSQEAIGLLRSTPGVSCVLVGMRQNAYVDDVLAELGKPPVADALAIWRRLVL